jgi:hypothetical protein
MWLLETVVYTSRFSTKIQDDCNKHIHNFHVSELLNFILDCPGACKKQKNTHLDPV